MSSGLNRHMRATITRSTTTVSIKRLLLHGTNAALGPNPLQTNGPLAHYDSQTISQIPFPQRRFSNGRDPHFDRRDRTKVLAKQISTLRTIFGGLGFWCSDFAFGFRISRDTNARSRANLHRIFFMNTKNRLCGHAETTKSPVMAFGPSCDVLLTE